MASPQRRDTVLLVCSLLVAGSASARAASIFVCHNNNAYAAFLEGGSDDGQFNTIEFSFTPNAGRLLTNLDDGFDGAQPRGPGEPYTFINQRLGLPTALGGLGYSVLGAMVEPDRVAFTTGPLGGAIDTSAQPQGRLFLANWYGARGDGVVTLYSGGNVVTSIDFVSLLDVPVPECPEPASGVLLALGGAGLVLAVRRRRA